MGMIALALMLIGGIVALIGGIWILVLAFSESILWGLGSLFVPFVSLIFVIMHWDKAAKPFLINVGGVVVMMVGGVLGGFMGEQASITFSTIGKSIDDN